jgi:hypothetical protein
MAKGFQPNNRSRRRARQRASTGAFTEIQGIDNEHDKRGGKPSVFRMYYPSGHR